MLAKHMFQKSWMLNMEKTILRESIILKTIQWVKDTEEFIIRGVCLKVWKKILLTARPSRSKGDSFSKMEQFMKVLYK